MYKYNQRIYVTCIGLVNHMTTSNYQATENPSIYHVAGDTTLMISNGRYSKLNVTNQWGNKRCVPRKCGCLTKSQPESECGNTPVWFQFGIWSCGKHRAYKKMLSNGDIPPPFEPFECSICMTECTTVDVSYTTPCNHKFHKRCIHTWSNHSITTACAISCPLCRRCIPSNHFQSLQTIVANLKLNTIDEQILLLTLICNQQTMPREEASNTNTILVDTFPRQTNETLNEFQHRMKEAYKGVVVLWEHGSMIR